MQSVPVQGMSNCTDPEDSTDQFLQAIRTLKVTLIRDMYLTQYKD